jgi:hypothetical protein
MKIIRPNIIFYLVVIVYFVRSLDAQTQQLVVHESVVQLVLYQTLGAQIAVVVDAFGHSRANACVTVQL